MCKLNNNKCISKQIFLGETKAVNSEEGNNSNEEKTHERELATASHEALFDPNSEVSMLDDFSTNDGSEHWEDTSEQNAEQSQVVLLGVNVNNNEDDVLRIV